MFSNRYLNYFYFPTNNKISQFILEGRFGLFLYFSLNLIISLLMTQFENLPTINAYIVIFLGFFYVFIKFDPLMMSLLCSYVVGSEVLWRMMLANVPYEFGKYYISFFLIMVLIRKKIQKIPILPLLYFFLLLPSILLTTQFIGVLESRELISFNLSGPLSVFICIWFFSNVKLSINHIKLIFNVFLGPVIGLSAVSIYNLLSNDIQLFSTQSNFLLRVY